MKASRSARLSYSTKIGVPQTIAEMKAVIEAAGLSHKGVVERVELEALAVEAQKTIDSCTQEGPQKQKRVSVFKLKKKVASKVGESKLGRNALLKMVGEAGVGIVQTLKESATALDNRIKAKELKHATVKWALKLGMLMKKKDLNPGNTKLLKDLSQLVAEKLLRECEQKPRGSRQIEDIHNDIQRLRAHIKQLLLPFSQQKNIEKLDVVLEYYGSTRFLTHLLNAESEESNCKTICHHISQIVQSLDSILERQAEQLERAKQLRTMLTVDASSCISGTFPEVTELFKEYLQARSTTTDGFVVGINALRFLVAAKEFRSVNNRGLRVPRAKLLYEKHIADGATHPVFGKDSEDVAKLRTSICAGLEEAKSTLFKELCSTLYEELSTKLFREFSRSRAYLDFEKRARLKIESLERVEILGS